MSIVPQDSLVQNPPEDSFASLTSPQARRFPLMVVLCLLLLFGLFIVYIGLGSVSLSPREVILALIGQPVERYQGIIIWDLRLPRGLVAVAVGLMLGLAGALMQTLTRNPLASPDLTGVTSGAVLMAVIWTSFAPPDLQNGPILILVAIVGGLCVGIIAFALSRQGRSDPLRLTLYGILLGAVLGSFISVLLLFENSSGGGIIDWLIGSLDGRTWDHWNTLWPWAVVTLPLALACAGVANVLNLGDEVATGLGQHPGLARTLLFFVAVLLTSSAVAVVGAIGFLGLIGPHIARRLTGDDARRLFPLSALIGALLLLLADFFVQAVTKEALPVGVFTALLGAPFFLYLILHKGGQQR